MARDKCGMAGRAYFICQLMTTTRARRGKRGQEGEGVATICIRKPGRAGL